jgi:hypothetical protein
MPRAKEIRLPRFRAYAYHSICCAAEEAEEHGTDSELKFWTAIVELFESRYDETKLPDISQRKMLDDLFGSLTPFN